MKDVDYRSTDDKIRKVDESISNETETARYTTKQCIFPSVARNVEGKPTNIPFIIKVLSAFACVTNSAKQHTALWQQLLIDDLYQLSACNIKRDRRHEANSLTAIIKFCHTFRV